jgi:hypothetical protein
LLFGILEFGDVPGDGKNDILVEHPPAKIASSKRLSGGAGGFQSVSSFVLRRTITRLILSNTAHHLSTGLIPPKQF